MTPTETIARAFAIVDRIDVSHDEPEIERLALALVRADALLRSWAGFAKALNLTTRNGELADYDDALASEIVGTATQTLRWRDGE